MLTTTPTFWFTVRHSTGPSSLDIIINVMCSITAHRRILIAIITLLRTRGTRYSLFLHFHCARAKEHLHTLQTLEGSCLHDAIVCVSQSERCVAARRRASQKEREAERAKESRRSRMPRGARERHNTEGEREEEGAGWKLEGRRSRPGLVLGLADSLALSQRNASNAGEPLRSLSFFRLLLLSRRFLLAHRVSFSHVLRTSRSLFPDPLSLSLSLARSLPAILLSHPDLPFIQFTLSFVALEERRRSHVASHTNSFFISLSTSASSLSLSLFLLGRSLVIKFCVFRRIA